MPAKQPAKPCSNCGRLFKPLRKGRCHTCDTYLRKRGVERPYDTDGRREKVKRQPCARCKRPWAFAKGLCESCYRVKQRCDEKGLPLPPFRYRQSQRAVIREMEAGHVVFLQAQLDAARAEMAQFREEVRQRFRKVEISIAGLARFRPGKRQKSTNENTELLDSIARGMANRPFSKLSAAHQHVVRSLAARLKSEPLS